MEYTRISDIPVPASRIGLGTWAMGGTQWGGADDDESVRTIHRALDLGITLIDTAPAYGAGHSESVVGRAIAEHGKREQVIIATKVGLEQRGADVVRNSTRSEIFTEIDASLRRLQTDYVDLYQVHWPDSRTPFEETAAAMQELKQSGKIRAIGVSNYSIEAMQRFSKVAKLSSAQPPLNVFERDAAARLIPWCKQNGLSTLTYGALCRGLLTGTIDESTRFEGDDLRKTDPKFMPPRFAQYTQAVERLERYARDRYGKGLLPFAIRWVLEQPGVSVALWGARHPGELDPVPDVMDFHLDGEALAHVEQVLREVIRDPVGPEFMAPPP